jgi:hypothetical protein
LNLLFEPARRRLLAIKRRLVHRKTRWRESIHPGETRAWVMTSHPGPAEACRHD